MKKVLSFVLILAMVLGSFAFTFAADADEMPVASDFSDYASINQVEAVDVMVATGVINGMPDGTFTPAGDVTRAQFAKMVAIVLNGGEDIGDYYSVACKFADVPAWAKGYVAYCSNLGVINGRDAKTFDPNSNVTAVEAAKMALVALGYNPEYEGYVGANWKVNVLADAKKNDLFDELSIKNYDLALNREAAAQVIFNAMKAPIVEYDQESAITIGDVKITQTTAATKVTDKNDNTIALFADKFTDPELTYAGAYTYKDGYGYWASTKKDVVRDAFGRPAHQWFLDGDEIGTYADAADYEFVAESNGALNTLVADFDEDLTLVDSNRLHKHNGDSISEDFANVLKGDKIELFEDGDEYVAIVINYTAAQITDVNTEVSTKDAKKDATAYITLDGFAADTYVDVEKASKKELVGFDADTYVEDAVIAIACNNSGAVVDSYVLEDKVSGEFTKDYAKKLYVDTTMYEKSGEAINLYNIGAETEDEVDLYLINGYAALIVEVESNTSINYGILMKVGSTSFGTNDTVKILTADGTVTTYEVDTDLAYTLYKADKEGIYKQEGKEDKFYVAQGKIKKDGKAEENFNNIFLGNVVAYTINDDETIDFVGAGMKVYISENEVTAKGPKEKVTVVDKVESTEMTYKTITGDADMTKKGLMAGKTVIDDVVVFDYDGTDKVDSDNYTILGYDDLAAAEDVYGYLVINEDNEVAALRTYTLSNSNTVVGILSDVDSRAKSGANTIYEVTLLIDGEAVEYDTIATSSNRFTDSSVIGQVVVAYVNADNEITSMRKAAEKSGAQLDPTSDFGGCDYVQLDAYTIFVSRSGNEVVVANGDDTYKINVEGAAVYKRVGGTVEADDYSLSDLEAGYTVEVYQLSEDADTWDVIVFTAAN